MVLSLISLFETVLSVDLSHAEIFLNLLKYWVWMLRFFVASVWRNVFRFICNSNGNQGLQKFLCIPSIPTVMVNPLLTKLLSDVKNLGFLPYVIKEHWQSMQSDLLLSATNTNNFISQNIMFALIPFIQHLRYHSIVVAKLSLFWMC